jgi:hypothetical protein
MPYKVEYTSIKPAEVEWWSFNNMSDFHTLMEWELSQHHLLLSKILSSPNPNTIISDEIYVSEEAFQTMMQMRSENSIWQSREAYNTANNIIRTAVFTTI